VVIISIQCVRL